MNYAFFKVRCGFTPTYYRQLNKIGIQSIYKDLDVELVDKVVLDTIAFSEPFAHAALT